MDKKFNDNDANFNAFLGKVYKATMNGFISWIPYGSGFAVKTSHHLYYSSIFIQRSGNNVWMSLYDLFDKCVMNGCFKARTNFPELKPISEISQVDQCTDTSLDNMNLLNSLYELVFNRHAKLEELTF